jgi:hypothetical protein
MSYKINLNPLNHILAIKNPRLCINSLRTVTRADETLRIKCIHWKEKDHESFYQMQTHVGSFKAHVVFLLLC